jgi:NADH:ubiquinone oxidoreductase subunit 3 (subunit A)
MENGNYLYPLLFLVGGLGFTAMNFTLAHFLAPNRRGLPEKEVAYECGEYPVGRAWVQYNVRYYLYAMMFVLFDVEVVFLFPWAAGFKSMLMDPTIGLLAFFEMLVFLALLIIAIAYAWRKGVMEWF